MADTSSTKNREEGEVVVVTGASAGVGRAIVREFAKRRCRIALLARNRDGLEAAKREVEQLGGQALVIPTDVAQWEQVEAAAEEVEEHFGPIDIWINNAMVGILAPFTELTPSEFRRVTEVTYLGQVYGAKAALNRMLPRDHGSIVFVGSALAYRGIPLQSAYCGAKHGVQGFYDSLRTELLHENSKVKISMVQLPGLNTTQFKLVRNKMPRKARPMGKVYQPEVAARAIVRAAYSGERELYVGYPTMQSILGDKVLPRFLDNLLSRRGYEGQMMEYPEDADRKDYLWDPVPGDHGAHGSFDDEATNKGLVLESSTFRAIVSTALLGLIIGGTALLTSSLRNGAADDED